MHAPWSILWDVVILNWDAFMSNFLFDSGRYGICPQRTARFKTGLTGDTTHTVQTMQTTLRLGSLVETRVTNDGRVSVCSFGGGGVSPNHGGLDTQLHTVRRHGSSHAVDHHPQIKETTAVIVSISNSRDARRNVDDGEVAETTFSFVEHSGPSSIRGLTGRNGRANSQYQYVGVPYSKEDIRNSTPRESLEC